MNIKSVSQILSLSPDTIRYYEKIGLMPHVSRNASGFREFNEQDVARLKFITCFRKAGVSIDRLTKYLKLVDEGPHTISDRLDILISEKEKLEQKRLELTDAIETLDYKIKNYQETISKIENHLFHEGEGKTENA